MPERWIEPSVACPPATEKFAAEDGLAALPAVPNLIATDVPGPVPPHAAINAALIKVKSVFLMVSLPNGILVRIGVALVHSLGKTNTSFAVRVCGRNPILSNVLGTVIQHHLYNG